jgi:hypothetical protein
MVRYLQSPVKQRAATMRNLEPIEATRGIGPKLTRPTDASRDLVPMPSETSVDMPFVGQTSAEMEAALFVRTTKLRYAEALVRGHVSRSYDPYFTELFGCMFIA